ncbi:DUF4132 domain-containing protein [Ramlibacter sp. WS9]|uniref:DUF4132 domain-containing protein n=1 Tax=Ramlibacter sp. WS9 TaxID=1882741 RepID=UPI001141A1A6|nr:DUF4132 domain-containing protein [Ramlibacter sp. WS9]ROZ74311.1 DUF4132 domain-containing protein [Ramlibacter sp. WS9]
MTVQTLPSILRDPPWLRADRPAELPAVEVAAIATAEAIDWPAPLLARLQARWVRTPASASDAFGFPQQLQLSAEGAQRLLAGQPLQAGDTQADYAWISCVMESPPDAQLALWNSFDRWHFSDLRHGEDILEVLARFGPEALPGALGMLATHAGKGPRVALMIDSPRLVDRMTGLARRASVHRGNAERWLAKFPRTTLCRALPQAFAAAPDAPRDQARHAIRWLAERGQSAQVLAVAAEYGDAMVAATEELLALDPLFMLPARIPRLPKFLQTAKLRPPRLRDGGAAMPAASIEAIATMLMLGQPDAPYPGLAQVREACTEASLAEFAWDLYEAWAVAGSPSADRWAFRTLGLLGDDETIARLAPLIEKWASDYTTRPRSDAAMEVAAVIASDRALALLDHQARKGCHRKVQQQAAAMLARVAEARGLTVDELSDRLVPGLGLDAPGSFVVDYGARNFPLRFDEDLQPFVRDAKGVRKKGLPRPQKGDDEALARAASERVKWLTKEARALAQQQKQRLERAMVLRRRWPAPAWRRLFLEHPLVRLLTARLAWGVFDGDHCVDVLRIAEDWSLADARDAHYTLADDAVVGIAHPLEMGERLRPMLQLFAEYEIAQPFAQLGRRTFELSPQERRALVLDRWEGKVGSPAGLHALAKWMWQYGESAHDGTVGSFLRPASGDLVATLQCDPGIPLRADLPAPAQALRGVRLFRLDESGRTPAEIGALDPVAASEILLEIESLISPGAGQ